MWYVGDSRTVMKVLLPQQLIMRRPLGPEAQPGAGPHDLYPWAGGRGLCPVAVGQATGGAIDLRKTEGHTKCLNIKGLVVSTICEDQ